MASGSSSTGPGLSLPDSMIPARISSKLRNIPTYKRELANFHIRQASFASRLTSLTTRSSVADFLDVKMEDAQAEIDHCSNLRDIFDEALHDKNLSHREWDELDKSFAQKRKAVHSNLRGIKKQRKIIEEDLEDMAGDKTRAELEWAYGELLNKCVQQASDNFKGFTKAQRKAFRRHVGGYLLAFRRNERGKKEAWCHVLGRWLETELVITAHLVPASLEGEELSYAFGVEQLSLTSATVGITLYTSVEKALDKGQIVFVPEPQPGGNIKDLKWKIIVTDPSIMKDSCFDQNFETLHNTYLQFRGENRPSRRYLYFRFVMTYLQHLKAGTTEWADALASKGYLWATPGKYLREGMLHALAKASGDVFLPQAWEEMIKTTSFNTSEAQKSDKIEKDYGRAISAEFKLASSRPTLDSDGEELEDSEDSE